MQASRADHIAEIVQAALECGAAERAQFLEEACGDDRSLRVEVESLLGFQEKARDFIESPAYEVASNILVEHNGELQPGQILGDYEIVSLLGQGGMGEVYLATDTKLERRVAIKIVKHAVGSASVLPHSRKEEKILAALNHPSIARLYGAEVTSSGLPYFVMEYVEGRRLDQYCREQELSIPDRLAIFRKVCAAITYAHQNLIIHRDIKPANIRVTIDGEPKLLDFGIAKLLDPETSSAAELTMTFAAVMTPEYASPEQVRGENITTASDVYSLGVVLYELLTGQRPYNIKTRNPTEIARVVSDYQPARPSTAVAKLEGTDSGRVVLDPRSLRGDLDNIVLKALRKESSRRYLSVAQFSDDIRRYLEGRPVSARKDTFKYRSLKFIKRNKLAVGAGGVIMLSLVAGIAATAVEARRANQQRARAEKRFNDVRRLANALMFEIHDSVKDLQGSTPTRRLIVSRALEYLDSLAREASGDPQLQRDLASAYEKVGDIQGNPYSANLGDVEGALSSYRKALAIREKLESKDQTVEASMELARSYRAMGDILEQKGDVAGTMQNYRRSTSMFEELAAAHSADLSVQDELARAYEAQGDGLGRVPDSAAERLKSYASALSIRQKLLAQKAYDPKLRRSVGLTLLKVGGANDAKKPESIDSIKHGINMLEKLSAEYPHNQRARREVGYGYYQLGNTFVEAGDYAAALESRRKAFAIREQIAAQDPKNAQAVFDLAVAHADISEALTASGSSTEAVDHAQHALSLLQELSAADPDNVVYSRNIGLCYEKLAAVFQRLGADESRSRAQRTKDWTEARAWYEKASRLFSELRDRGTLMPADSEQPAKFENKVRECDAAISSLKVNPGSAGP
ncbi:MAG TPA: protein kinase [Candidatus Udaeobacter sp.]|nr:protein kinase [Candidatus Udaeobacter sp.]